MIEFCLRHGIRTTAAVLHRFRRGLISRLTHSGRPDLALSAGMSLPVLPAQVGIDEAEQVLCAGTMPLARLITVGFGTITMYFLLKFLVQLQFGLDTAGKVPSGRDPSLNLLKKNRYKQLRTREALYSLLAGLFPSLMLLVVLPVLNIDVIDCLI